MNPDRSKRLPALDKTTTRHRDYFSIDIISIDTSSQQVKQGAQTKKILKSARNQQIITLRSQSIIQ